MKANVFVSVASLVVCAGCATLTPATPPLLRGVTAGHGSWASGGCPPTRFDPPLPEASSPELAERLRSQFPPGTPSQVLVEDLRGQGFVATSPCENDKSIHRMIFSQEGGSILPPFPVSAAVAWKEDAAGRIVWTKGQVEFTGL